MPRNRTNKIFQENWFARKRPGKERRLSKMPLCYYGKIFLKMTDVSVPNERVECH